MTISRELNTQIMVNHSPSIKMDYSVAMTQSDVNFLLSWENGHNLWVKLRLIKNIYVC